MTDIYERISELSRQHQFLSVQGRDSAKQAFHAHLDLCPLGVEEVSLANALGRVLAASLLSDVDVPGFDRSSVDGFAIRAADVTDASENAPKRLRVNPEILTPGKVPEHPVRPGWASLIATGGMVPRGADAVVMVEHTESRQDEDGGVEITVTRPVAPGGAIAWAGGDIARGETVLRPGRVLTSREIGMVAAVGVDRLSVYRRPRVAILSTGDEIVAPGQPIPQGGVYDSNAAILAAAVTEAGGEPLPLGVVHDDAEALQDRVAQALEQADMVLMSGGTSKGAGDVCYRVVSGYDDPGIIVHGVALKPGKPICLAVTGGKPLIILPGFPTSAIFTYHDFVAPVIRAFAGLPETAVEHLRATVPMRVPSERGRTEFTMVSVSKQADGALAAYPVSKGSGSVSTFSSADGFITIDQHSEGLPAGHAVDVRLIGHAPRLADLSVIGSHCVGLDVLVDVLEAEGISVKILNVGSNGGLAAARRGECDIAPIHLLDPESGVYNRPFLTEGLTLVEGYRRMQGVVFRKGDARLDGLTAEKAVATLLVDPDSLMVNRNAGSGTRILIDGLLGGARPPGYWAQPKSHNAVAVAVAQKRADWGVTIRGVAEHYGLGFLPLREECYDFAIPAARADHPAVARFRALLRDPALQDRLAALRLDVRKD